MRAEDIREMEQATVLEALSSAEQEIMGLRMKNTIGSNENPLIIRGRKRDVARMKTVLRERALKSGKKHGKN